MGRKAINLSGKVINGIKVIKMAACEHGTGKHIKWECECPVCHGVYVTGSNHLISGETRMCRKCAEKLATPPHGEPKYAVGMKYGCWEIIGETGFNNSRRVRCECGKQFTPDIIAIKHAPASCNCVIKSKGEQGIYKWLKAHNIEYEMQKTFPSCRANERMLMFDFFLPQYNALIEHDDVAHYYGARYNETYKQHDEYKNAWAAANHYDLIRIAHNEDLNKRLSEEIVRLRGNT